MGWTAPTLGSDFAVGEIVTAAKLNSHITDNLRYLKGLDGAVAIQNTLTATAGAPSTDIVSALSGSAANAAGFSVGRAASEARFALAAGGGQFANDAATGDCVIRVDDSTKKLRLLAGAGNAALVVGNNAVGINQASPVGSLHVKGASAGGGVAFYDYSGLAATTTIFPNGTVTKALNVLCWATTPSSGAYQSSGTTLTSMTPGSGSVNVWTDGGTNVLQLSVNASGGIVLTLTGARTYSGYMLMAWL